MKKISFTTGILIVCLAILFLTGFLDFDNRVNNSIIEGNKYYKSGDYDKALEVYQKSLVNYPDNELLNYNSGQASYRLSKFQEAIDYYNKANETVDRYLNSGNCSLKIGDSIEENNINEKLQYYNNSLETYKNGIIEFPQNVKLKYNYEFVKQKIDELNKKQKQQENDKQQQDNKNQENKEDQKNNNNQQNKDNSQQKDNNQDKDNKNDSKENKNNKENQENEDDQNNQTDKEDKEGQDNLDSKEDHKDQNKDEEQKKSNTNKSEEKNEDQKDIIENKENKSVDDNNPSEFNQNNEEIMQILKMLEKQEEDSLKNNHEVQNGGKEDKYDW